MIIHAYEMNFYNYQYVKTCFFQKMWIFFSGNPIESDKMLDISLLFPGFFFCIQLQLPSGKLT